MDDYERLVKLSQVFPEIDMAGGTIVEPNDRPLDSRHLEMVFALMTLSDKPFMGSVTSGRERPSTRSPWQTSSSADEPPSKRAPSCCRSSTSTPRCASTGGCWRRCSSTPGRTSLSS